MANSAENAGSPIDQGPLRGDRVINELMQGDELQLMKQDISFDFVKIKCLKFDSIQSVIFTKLESSTSQKRACVT